jgi:hypothetical protein
MVIAEMVSFVEKVSQPPVCSEDVEWTDCTAGKENV